MMTSHEKNFVSSPGKEFNYFVSPARFLLLLDYIQLSFKFVLFNFEISSKLMTRNYDRIWAEIYQKKREISLNKFSLSQTKSGGKKSHLKPSNLGLLAKGTKIKETRRFPCKSEIQLQSSPTTNISDV